MRASSIAMPTPDALGGLVSWGRDLSTQENSLLVVCARGVRFVVIDVCTSRVVMTTDHVVSFWCFASFQGCNDVGNIDRKQYRGSYTLDVAGC